MASLSTSGVCALDDDLLNHMYYYLLDSTAQARNNAYLPGTMRTCQEQCVPARNNAYLPGTMRTCQEQCVPARNNAYLHVDVKVSDSCFSRVDGERHGETGEHSVWLDALSTHLHLTGVKHRLHLGFEWAATIHVYFEPQLQSMKL